MTKSLILLALFSASSFGGAMQFEASKLDHARKMGFISSSTLIVKIPSAKVPDEIQYLGDFKPFFEAEDGLWGSLHLYLIPDSYSASYILSDLAQVSEVLEAYFSPLPKDATVETEVGALPKVLTADLENYVETPDFEARQNYLQDSPVGVGAMAAWDLPGGTGRNVKVIDIETCFEEAHEDFNIPFWVGGNPKCGSTNHGTAVWGEIAAKRDGKGVTGIAHEAEFGIYGFIEGDLADVNEAYIDSINKGIQGATAELEAGDVLVIEQQMIGPELQKYTAVEYWPHIFDQLKAATKKGIICVEAAGNGDSNFDDASYEGAFDLRKRDSGCIMVGAVDSVSKERLSFSNYGSRLDASGFGRGVVTTGYGHLFNQGPTRLYTDRFSGTSSATPIVAGAIAVVSSIAKEKGRPISPRRFRNALRATGIKQGMSGIEKRVGNFPDIKAMRRYLRL